MLKIVSKTLTCFLDQARYTFFFFLTLAHSHMCSMILCACYNTVLCTIVHSRVGPKFLTKVWGWFFWTENAFSNAKPHTFSNNWTFSTSIFQWKAGRGKWERAFSLTKTYFQIFSKILKDWLNILIKETKNFTEHFKWNEKLSLL